MTPEGMQDILNALCEREGCRLDQPGTQSGQAGMMYVEFGYVEGPTLNDIPIGHYPNLESKYMTCLHEIGHFHHAHTQGRPFTDEYIQKCHDLYDNEDEWENQQWYFDNGVLRSEAEAWNYALDKCGIPSDEMAPETRAFMWETCLSSYFSHARAVGFATPGQKLYNGDRAYVEFAYGKPDKYFYGIKRRILEGDDVVEPLKKREQSSVPPINVNIDWSNIASSATWFSDQNPYYTGTGATTNIIYGNTTRGTGT